MYTHNSNLDNLLHSFRNEVQKQQQHSPQQSSPPRPSSQPRRTSPPPGTTFRAYQMEPTSMIVLSSGEVVQQDQQQHYDQQQHSHKNPLSSTNNTSNMMMGQHTHEYHRHLPASFTSPMTSNQYYHQTHHHHHQGRRPSPQSHQQHSTTLFNTNNISDHSPLRTTPRRDASALFSRQQGDDAEEDRPDWKGPLDRGGAMAYKDFTMDDYEEHRDAQGNIRRVANTSPQLNKSLQRTRYPHAGKEVELDSQLFDQFVVDCVGGRRYQQYRQQPYSTIQQPDSNIGNYPTKFPQTRTVVVVRGTDDDGGRQYSSTSPQQQQQQQHHHSSSSRRDDMPKYHQHQHHQHQHHEQQEDAAARTTPTSHEVYYQDPWNFGQHQQQNTSSRSPQQHQHHRVGSSTPLSESNLQTLHEQQQQQQQQHVSSSSPRVPLYEQYQTASSSGSPSILKNRPPRPAEQQQNQNQNQNQDEQQQQQQHHHSAYNNLKNKLISTSNNGSRPPSPSPYHHLSPENNNHFYNNSNQEYRLKAFSSPSQTKEELARQPKVRSIHGDGENDDQTSKRRVEIEEAKKNQKFFDISSSSSPAPLGQRPYRSAPPIPVVQSHQLEEQQQQQRQYSSPPQEVRIESSPASRTKEQQQQQSSLPENFSPSRVIMATMETQTDLKQHDIVKKEEQTPSPPRREPSAAVAITQTPSPPPPVESVSRGISVTTPSVEQETQTNDAALRKFEEDKKKQRQQQQDDESEQRRRIEDEELRMRFKFQMIEDEEKKKKLHPVVEIETQTEVKEEEEKVVVPAAPQTAEIGIETEKQPVEEDKKKPELVEMNTQTNSVRFMIDEEQQPLDSSEQSHLTNVFHEQPEQQQQQLQAASASGRGSLLAESSKDINPIPMSASANTVAPSSGDASINLDDDRDEHYNRVMLFYQYYAPEKATTDTVEAALSRFPRKEDKQKMYDKLIAKYGQEPTREMIIARASEQSVTTSSTIGDSSVNPPIVHEEEESNKINTTPYNEAYLPRLRMFNKKYRPSQTEDDMKNELTKFKGLEEELFNSLFKEYGPREEIEDEKTASTITEEYYSKLTPEEKERLHEQQLAKYGPRLTRFYEKYDKSLAAPEHVEKALLRYIGKEEEMFRILVDSYGPEEDKQQEQQQQQQASSSRSVTNNNNNNQEYFPRLTRFYEKYAPEKAEPSNVHKALDRYAGREEELFDTLRKKYGEEPVEEIVTTTKVVTTTTEEVEVTDDDDEVDEKKKTETTQQQQQQTNTQNTQKTTSTTNNNASDTTIPQENLSSIDNSITQLPPQYLLYAPRLSRFYQRYEPSKNNEDHIKKTLSRYVNKEEEMFAILVDRYGGPEPDADGRVVVEQQQQQQPAIVNNTDTTNNTTATTTTTTTISSSPSTQLQHQPEQQQQQQVVPAQSEQVSVTHHQTNTAPNGQQQQQQQHDYFTRLTRFYQFYNVLEKATPENVNRALERYFGKEEEMFETLKKKYGDEPPSSWSPKNNNNQNQTSNNEQQQTATTTTTTIVTTTSTSDANATNHSHQNQPQQQPEQQQQTTTTAPQLSYRTRLIRFYTVYAPEKLSNVDEALKRFEGNEETMMVRLVQKYGAEPAHDVVIPTDQVGKNNNNQNQNQDHFSRLTRFYQKYAPEKADAGNVQKALDRYAGKEEEMFETLRKKYGPEP